MLIIEEKLIQVDMLRLEVGRKGLRADVPHERERERERERDADAFERTDIVES